MNTLTFCGAASALALCGQLLPIAPVAAQTMEASAEQGVETLTRGPVHEAFAATLSYNPTPGIIVNKAPPAAIEERPPDQRPDGNNVAWIGGYWGWDDETSDFLWISGVWRNLPPGRQWMPGYWNPLDDGYQWVSGYWADAATREVTYLPEPPASLERGPSVSAPDDSYAWSPGYWSWYDDRYAWSPGYWQPAHSNWVWIPGHYVWTPRGYIYVSGYWDYEPVHRGVLFAPVRFSRYDFGPDYYYSPSFVVSLLFFTDHLFVRPGYCHYYYGDYYDRRYSDRGFFASYSYLNSRRGYDPIFAYERWQHRRDRNWLSSREAMFDRLRANESERPARTLAALGASKEAAAILPLERYAKEGKSAPRFKALSNPERQQLVAQRLDVQKVGMERKKLEAISKNREGIKPARPEKAEFLASPVVGKSAASLGKGAAPPKLPPARKLELKKPDAGTAKELTPKLPPAGRKEGEPGRKAKPDTEITPTKPEPSDKPPKITPRKDPAPEPRKEPKVTPPPPRKVEPPAPVPKVKPAPREEVIRPVRPAPKVEPRPAPKVEPRPAPKVEPRPAPRVEPRPAPKVEPRPAPRPAPKVEPRPEPRPAPKQPAPEAPQRKVKEEEKKSAQP